MFVIVGFFYYHITFSLEKCGKTSGNIGISSTCVCSFEILSFLQRQEGKPEPSR